MVVVEMIISMETLEMIISLGVMMMTISMAVRVWILFSAEMGLIRLSIH